MDFDVFPAGTRTIHRTKIGRFRKIWDALNQYDELFLSKCPGNHPGHGIHNCSLQMTMGQRKRREQIHGSVFHLSDGSVRIVKTQSSNAPK